MEQINGLWSEDPGTLEPYPLPAVSFKKVSNGATGIAKELFSIRCGFNTEPQEEVAQIVQKTPFS